MAADQRQQALRDAIAQVYKDHADGPATRGILTDFVVIAEFVGDDGDHWLAVTPDGDAPLWRQVGLLEYATADRKAEIGHDGEEDPGEWLG